MGLETAPQQSLGRIDPSSITGKADTGIVSPSAVAALTEAFRNGAITADDIVARVGELGKAKQKAQLQMANEATSPEAIAARQNQTRLAGAQAGASIPLVQPQADIAKTQMEQTAAYQKYPAAQFFDQYAPSLGLEVPLDANGKPDYARKAEIGSQLAVWLTEKERAKTELANIDTHASADGTQLLPVTKQGMPVPVSHVKELQDKVSRPFQLMKPGASQTSVAAPAAGYTPPTQTVYGADAQAAADAAERAAKGAPAPAVAPITIAPKPALAPGAKPVVGTTPPAGTQLGDTGFSLGSPKAKDMQDKAPTEAQQRAELALARFAQSNDMFSSLKSAGYDPTSVNSWMDSFLPEVLKSGNRKAYDSAVDAWSQGLLRLESGAAISRQEKTWYDKAFFPQVNDPPAVVESKGQMRRDIERMVGEIAQAGAVVSPESAAQVQRIYQQAGASLTPIGAKGGAPAVGPVITLSTGKKVIKGPDGKAYVAP
jgi:hypothetical protein